MFVSNGTRVHQCRWFAAKFMVSGPSQHALREAGLLPVRSALDIIGGHVRSARTTTVACDGSKPSNRTAARLALPGRCKIVVGNRLPAHDHGPLPRQPQRNHRPFTDRRRPGQRAGGQADRLSSRLREKQAIVSTSEALSTRRPAAAKRSACIHGGCEAKCIGFSANV